MNDNDYIFYICSFIISVFNLIEFIAVNIFAQILLACVIINIGSFTIMNPLTLSFVILHSQNYAIYLVKLLSPFLDPVTSYKREENSDFTRTTCATL